MQEHHLDGSVPRKQALSDLLFFYGEAGDGSSGVLTCIKKDLEPRVVFNHPSDRVLGVSVKVNNALITIVNIYAPNDPKGRKIL